MQHVYIFAQAFELLAVVDEDEPSFGSPEWTEWMETRSPPRIQLSRVTDAIKEVFPLLVAELIRSRDAQERASDVIRALQKVRDPGFVPPVTVLADNQCGCGAPEIVQAREPCLPWLQRAAADDVPARLRPTRT